MNEKSLQENAKLKLEPLKGADPYPREVEQSAYLRSRKLLADLRGLSGKEILDQIMEHENPGELIQALPCEDFFWLAKKIGDDDCIPLLELGSEEQWQYLLDLEIWSKDRINIDSVSTWLNRIERADATRLVRWLLSHGQDLAYCHFFRSLQVLVLHSKEEVYELSEEFFTVDGVFHIRVAKPEHRTTLENLISAMAAEDYDRYHSLFLGLAGVLPAEMEEDIYRLRNVRLAEHGFLPFEEALSVYAPLKIESIIPRRLDELPRDLVDEEIGALVPVLPFYHAGTRNMFVEAVSGLTDPVLLDKVRLDFAGLCNQILSAEGVLTYDIDVLTHTCRKAARLINLAVDRFCGKELAAAKDLLRNHTLLSLFRVGYGLAMKLKWEAERWLEGSWFHTLGLDSGFWGEDWGGVLSGLLQKRPSLYAGVHQEEPYRDFEWLSDLGDCLKILRRLMVLDSLLERLSEHYPMDRELMGSEVITFYPLLFNLWSRLLLKLDPCFSGISLDQAKRFFEKLRAGSTQPPYRMPGFEEAFVTEFMGYASSGEFEALSILKEALSEVWQGFLQEYEWVSGADLDERYSNYLTITTLR
jgi:hypothetical protein